MRKRAISPSGPPAGNRRAVTAAGRGALSSPIPYASDCGSNRRAGTRAEARAAARAQAGVTSVSPRTSGCRRLISGARPRKRRFATSTLNETMRTVGAVAGAGGLPDPCHGAIAARFSPASRAATAASRIARSGRAPTAANASAAAYWRRKKLRGSKIQESWSRNPASDASASSAISVRGTISAVRRAAPLMIGDVFPRQEAGGSAGSRAAAAA